MRTAILPLALLVCLASIVYADFAAGLRSYQKGDYVSALKEWLPLAEQGDAVSQNNIGSLFQFGRGAPQNYEQAAKWYQKAADQGLAVAQNNLGFCYLRGHGISQDYLQAQVWFTLAGPGKDQEDVDARAELARLLTPDQISQAFQLAQDWHQNCNLACCVRPPPVHSVAVWPTRNQREVSRKRSGLQDDTDG